MTRLCLPALVWLSLAGRGVPAQPLVVPPSAAPPSQGCTGFGYGFTLDRPARTLDEILLHAPVVRSVNSAGPGGRAGLRSGDTLLVVDGDTVPRRGMGRLRARPPGTRFSLRVRRDGTERDVVLISGRRVPSAASAGASLCVPLADTTRQDTLVTHHARGTFDVTITPTPADDHADGAALGRMTLDKRFHGDLDATSRGQMLTAMTAVEGSAGYVAIERVTGTLGGRRGSFVFQHSGTMERGAQRLTLTVVPDSGTDELTGIAGEMTIRIANGVHAYAFAYTLPAR